MRVTLLCLWMSNSQFVSFLAWNSNRKLWRTDCFFFMPQKSEALAAGTESKEEKHNISLQVPELIPVSKPKPCESSDSHPIFGFHIRNTTESAFYQLKNTDGIWDIVFLPSQCRGSVLCFYWWCPAFWSSWGGFDVQAKTRNRAHVTPISKSLTGYLYALEIILTYIK